MTIFPEFIREHEEGVILHLAVQPKAKHPGIQGVHGASLKVRISAPPVDGKANQEIISYFSELLSKPKRSIEVIGGLTSRNKVLLVRGCDRNAVLKSLRSVMEI